MRKRGLRLAVGLAIVAVGAVQAGVAAVGGDHVYTGLGVVYALVGVAQLWVEGLGLRR